MTSQLKILFAGFGDIARRVASRSEFEQVEKVAIRRSAITGGNVDSLSGDLRDTEFLTKVLAKKFDAVVITVTADDFSDQGYRDSYVAVANSFAKAVSAAENPPRLLIWVSSTSVYGDAADEWVDEYSEAKPGGFSGKRQLEAEQMIESIDVPSVIIRFSGIYGPGRNRMAAQVKAGHVVTDKPVVWSNRIHSEDCAGVISHLMRSYWSGDVLAPLYLASDCEPVPLHEVHHWLAEKLEVKEMEAKPGSRRTSKRCSNQKLLETGYQFRYPNFRAGYSELLESD